MRPFLRGIAAAVGSFGLFKGSEEQRKEAFGFFYSGPLLYGVTMAGGFLAEA